MDTNKELFNAIFNSLPTENSIDLSGAYERTRFVERIIEKITGNQTVEILSNFKINKNVYNKYKIVKKIENLDLKQLKAKYGNICTIHKIAVKDLPENLRKRNLISREDYIWAVKKMQDLVK